MSKLTLTGRLPARAVPEHDEERRQQRPVRPPHDARLPGRGRGADRHGGAAAVRAPPGARGVSRHLGGHLAVLPVRRQVPRGLAPGKYILCIVTVISR